MIREHTHSVPDAETAKMEAASTYARNALQSSVFRVQDHNGHGVAMTKSYAQNATQKSSTQWARYVPEDSVTIDTFQHLHRPVSLRRGLGGLFLFLKIRNLPAGRQEKIYL